MQKLWMALCLLGMLTYGVPATRGAESSANQTQVEQKENGSESEAGEKAEAGEKDEATEVNGKAEKAEDEAGEKAEGKEEDEKTEKAMNGKEEKESGEANEKAESVSGAMAADGDFLSTFNVDKSKLKTTGRNTYFILEPGYTMHYEGPNAALKITVLNETKMVDGVETRVVEEYETANGKVTEVSRNYFAIDPKTKDLYYFGEDGGGSWHSGENGAKFGLFIPGKPKVGEKYYQEYAPKDKAMDRFEIVSLNDTYTCPAGTFKNVLKTKESSAVEAGGDTKLYAPGVGLVQDGDLKLVKYGQEKMK